MSKTWHGRTDTSRWRADCVCCGREDGSYYFDTWEQADAFRESYTGGGDAKSDTVDPHGYSGRQYGGGHKRAVILSEVTP